jgi:aryl-alcohol dehydrogenase-like predicted oxidoreductase
MNAETVETTELYPGYVISRLIKGGWQLAGGHGEVVTADALADMAAYVEAGITTFDCGDIYTGVEELIGAFRRAALAASRAALKVHTKFVPDLDLLAHIGRADVRRVIDRSLRRLGLERLDLVQFHWWDYAQPSWLDTALWLAELQREGKIDLIGGTNFDTEHTARLLAAGVNVRTMQVQYSLLDDRPARAMAALCATHGMRLLCYGTVAGGFLSERWLGVAEPTGALENRSLVKYKLIIDDAGGWDWLQALLATLAGVAGRHGCDIASVASRWVLDLPHVAAVIVGVRSRAHLERHRRLFGVALDAQDRAAIAAVLAERHPLEGDVYALERDRNGRHGRIMKYDLGDR